MRDMSCARRSRSSWAISTRCDRASCKIGDGVRRVHETMLDESRKMRRIIEKLILLARLEREDASVNDVIDLHSVAARAVDALRPLAGERIAPRGRR